MKNLLIGMAGCLLATGNGAAFTAQDGFGIGFILGSPSGLSGSLPIGPSNAFNAVIGYDVTRDINLHLQADYVWIRSDLIPVEIGKVSLYYGPGAFARISGEAALGIRVVGGIDYRFQDAPLQFFLEIGPGINVVPNTAANVGAGLGLRYYF
jgi:hypothetical protein